MLRQHGDVLAPLAERDDLDGDDVEPVEQVRAKAPRVDQRGEILVRGGDHPHIQLHGLIAAQGFDFLLLEHAQHLGLDLQAHVAHLVQEEGALVRLLELAALVLGGAGERAFAITEQLAFDEVVGDGGAVDLHELLVAAVAFLVDEPGQQLLPRPVLTEDEHAAGRGGDDIDLLAQGQYGNGLPHHLVAAHVALAQLPVLLLQLPVLERVLDHHQGFFQ